MNPNKIRLLHLMKSCGIGGVEKSTILYSNELINKLEAVGIYGSKGMFDESKFIDLRIKRFFPPHDIWRKYYFFNNLFNLISVVNKNKFTHIHYHHRIYFPFLIIIKLLFIRVEIIYSHHNIFDDKLNTFIMCDKLITFNKSTKNDIPKRLQNKTTIIPHGIKIANQLKPSPVNFQNLGFVGRFVHKKGIIKLIDSFAELSKNFKNLTLILVGDGPLKQYLIERVNELRLKSKVIFKKPELDINKIYSSIDILILASEKSESFPLVILEALSMGIPVVLSNIEPFIELVEDNITGKIVHNNLADELLNILKNKEILNKMRLNAFNLVSEKYDLEKTVELYLKIYSQ